MSSAGPPTPTHATPLGHRQLAGCVLLDAQRHILLIHRLKGPPQWELPGGKVEHLESPADAAKRELWEELGIRVVLDHQLGHAVFEQSGTAWIYVWYLSRRWTGCPAIKEPQTFDGLARFTVAELSGAGRGFSPSVRALGDRLSRNELVL